MVNNSRAKNLQKKKHSSKKQLYLNTTLKDFFVELCKKVGKVETNSDVNSVTDCDSAIKYFIEICSAQLFVGAGVGGLLINEVKKQVLLYWRPKSVEKHKWSMPGGSIRCGSSPEDTLVHNTKLIMDITITEKNIRPLRITNHCAKDEKGDLIYQFLSPAFVVDLSEAQIRKIEKIISREEQIENKEEAMKIAEAYIYSDQEEGKTTDIQEALATQLIKGGFYTVDWDNTTKQKIIHDDSKHACKYIVKWFDIDYVKSHTDEFSTPTILAIASYCEWTNQIKKLYSEVNNAKL